MSDRTRLARIADTMIELGKEIKAALKEDKQLFALPKKDVVIASGRDNVRRAIDAQEVIKKWRYNWAKIYRNDPIIEKKWVYMTTSVLRRVPIQTVFEALNNYFDSQEQFLERQRYPYPLFITHINKYLPEGRLGHEQIRQMGTASVGERQSIPRPLGEGNGQGDLYGQSRNHRPNEEDFEEQLDR